LLHSHSPTTKDIASFYDETLRERLWDYVDGNPRIIKGLGLVNSLIDRSTEKLLEIGCGLGITSSELARAHKWLRIHAVDISPATISTARRLFGENDRLVFEVSEVSEAPRFAPYDIITLLDVYEHIPRETWPRFHSTLGRSLSPTGAIVLTLPSPLHQEHLARVNPSGLQIVDQVVELKDLAALAQDVSGCLVYFAYVSIWNTNDYMHAVISRGCDYRPLKWQRPEKLLGRINGRILSWLDRTRRWDIAARRRRLIQRRLGVTLGKAK